MKKQLRKFLPLVAVLSLLIATASFVSVQSKFFGIDSVESKLQVNEADKYSVIQQAVCLVLADGHLEPKPFDDKTSKDIYKQYITSLDFNKHFLLQEDVDQLAVFETKIDNEILAGTHQFFDLSDKLISQRIQETSEIYEGILSQPFDFSVDEMIELDNEKVTFSKSLEERTEIWRKYLKYQTLTRLTDLQEQEEKNDSTEKKTFEALELEAREKVGKSQKNWFRRLNQLDSDDRFSYYINSITAVFDPHTTYLPPKDKENFDIRFSGKLEGIGAVLRETDGAIKVDRIVTGSASWKQGDLKAGDVIIKVAQGNEDPVDIQGMPLDDAVKLIRGKKDTEVRLTVKKKEGRTIVVPIIRDIVVLAETYAKSSIIKQGKKRFGVIHLPHFYADFNDRNGRNCYDDIAKEINKLNAEKVHGIIFDLRDNGGGSLYHVIEMVGLFTGKGPVVQTKESRGIKVKSSTTAIAYDGPMTVLVNSNSASASEIFAAALQDYKRAVIIGGNSSFGKGTVQNFADLDQIFANSFNDGDVKPMGSVKLTIQKFYRIDGGSTQRKGVIPDIIVPDMYKYIEYGEREYEFALPYDAIPTAKYESSKDGVKNMEKVKEESKKRVGQSEAFKLIDENAKRVERVSNETKYSLNIVTYNAYIAKIEKEAAKFKDILKKNEDLSIYTMEVDKAEFEKDDIQKEKIKKWHEALQKDPYVQEAINVLGDLK
jgi:carboxyl-terminal processing protease